jgi:hypothetical protein
MEIMITDRKSETFVPCGRSLTYIYSGCRSGDALKYMARHPLPFVPLKACKLCIPGGGLVRLV